MRFKVKEHEHSIKQRRVNRLDPATNRFRRVGCGWAALLGHVGHVDGFPVEVGGHFGGLGDVAAVHEPEAGRHGGGEGNAVVDKGQRSGSGHVLPLSAGSATCASGNRRPQQRAPTRASKKKTRVIDGGRHTDSGIIQSASEALIAMAVQKKYTQRPERDEGEAARESQIKSKGRDERRAERRQEEKKGDGGEKPKNEVEGRVNQWKEGRWRRRAE